MTAHILKLGVVNFHTYLFEELDVSGDTNALVLRADNGVGKTTLMTALYPTVLTMDLNRSLNFGKKPNVRLGERTSASMVKSQSYIYMKLIHEFRPLTLVVSFKKKADGTVGNQANVFETHDLVLWENNQAVDLAEVKRRYKDFKLHTFDAQSQYVDWVAKELFGIDTQKFESSVRIGYRLADKEALARFEKSSLGDLVQEVKQGFISITDRPSVSDNIEDYAKTVIEFYYHQKEIENKTRLLTYLGKLRDLNYSENSKLLRKVDSEVKRLIGGVSALNQEVLTLSSNLETYRLDIELKEKQLSEKESTLEELETAQLDCLVQLKTNDVSSKIEQLTERLSYLRREHQSLQDSFDTETKQLNKLADREQDLVNRKDTLSKSLLELGTEPLPFDLEEWGTIKQSYLEYEKVQKDIEDLSKEIGLYVREKTSIIKAVDDLTSQLETEKEKYESEVSSFLDLLGVSFEDDETLSQLISRVSTKLRSDFVEVRTEKDTLQREIKALETEISHLENSDSPETSYKAQNGVPLYEVVDFIDSVPNSKREEIEANLKGSGLLELLVKFDSVEKGYYLE